MEKPNPSKAKKSVAPAAPAATAESKAVKPAVAPAAPLPPLYRKIDWLTFAVTTLLVFIGYYLTLAPDLTLEDAGELATASFYAGVPHPPGYPVWTIYTWLFTRLVPFSNVAWRVALSSAVAGALSCGLIALLVSRGSSMILEGIAELKNIERRLENPICMVSGFVAGMLLGFNGFMWSQAVIVEVYTFSVLSLMGVLCCLLRWTYAPDQRRYLYWAFFIFGICFTNHMTLVVAAMGIEVAIVARQPKLGRDLLLGNSVAYVAGLMLKVNGVITSFDNNTPLFMIYNVVGLGSLGACTWLTLQTKSLATEWKPAVIMGLLWIAGAAFYFYMPLSSMTNPPLNWGYPRTWDGFIHALTRGQYERANPTNDPIKFIKQLWIYGEGAVDEFNVVYLLIGLIPYLFYRRMQKRERAWIVGLTGIFLCLAVLLLMILNPAPDRQSKELNRVFFTASHVIVAMGIGYGLTLIAATLTTQYERFRIWALVASAVSAGTALYAYANLQTQFPLARYTAIFSLSLALICVLLFAAFRKNFPMAALLGVFSLMPAYSVLSHWADNEQRGHLFGYWFGHDMFTPPFGIYPEMGRNAVLYGGTDPGRFNPTYMIFCESFIPPKNKPLDPKFDRRDVCLITQNALADNTYLNYIRAHYNRSAQKDPPFFQEMFRTRSDIERGTTNLLARLVSPLDRFFTDLGDRMEKARRAKGVYPPTEIITASPDDSTKAFQDYIADAQRRLQHDSQFPNEPRQIKPGEDVKIIENKIQVSGQVAVMAINALLTKVMFDKNPEREFYVEESFPLDWMFPHLTPFGIIMKIHHQPVPELTEEMVKQDHEFWTKYSERLAGNWITYDTPVKQITDFAERVYLHRDLKNYTGDRKFARDDNAQKAFSKLRSAIAGVYRWRINNAKTTAEQQRMLKEADFAFRQALAFCPYSPEAVFRYVDLLATVGRLDDALLIAETCFKFDLENGSVANLVSQLRAMKQGQSGAVQIQQQITQLEEQYRTNTSNVPLAFQLISSHLQLQRTNAALQIMDQLLANPGLDANAVASLANAYSQLGQTPRVESALHKLDQFLANPAVDAGTVLQIAAGYSQLGQAPRAETALRKLVGLVPENPEAWYDLAVFQAMLGKPPESINSLSNSLRLSAQRLIKQPTAKNLLTEANGDKRFDALRQLPEFQKLVAPK